MKLTITERQLKALANQVIGMPRMGWSLSISNTDKLSEGEMLDLERRMIEAYNPLKDAEVEVEVK
jgi:hypothetical protein